MKSILIPLLSLLATCHASVQWGANCSYTDEPQTTALTVQAGSDAVFVTTIPAGKDKVYIKLTGTGDLDTKLVANDGTILIAYDNGWTHGSFSSRNSIPFSYNGMGFKSCVDSCTEDVTLEYHDGSTFTLEGSGSFSNEWVYINTTTEDLSLYIDAFQSGTGTVEWLWDCPAECNFCVAVTPSPTQVPVLPPTSLPTLQPSHDPTHLPTPRDYTPRPSFAATPEPSAVPIPLPTPQPSSPTSQPTSEPIPSPTSAPVFSPTVPPSMQPIPSPTLAPVFSPTVPPSMQPIPSPTLAPVFSPTQAPTVFNCLGDCSTTVSDALTSSNYGAVCDSDLTCSNDCSVNYVEEVAVYCSCGSITTDYEYDFCCSDSWDCKGAIVDLYAADNGLNTKVAHAALAGSCGEVECPVDDDGSTMIGTYAPSGAPTRMPTSHPTLSPAFSSAPSVVPSPQPTAPSPKPSSLPTAAPTMVPSMPTGIPTPVPSPSPTQVPTSKPSAVPTIVPSPAPTQVPTHSPTHMPTPSPTAGPYAMIKSDITMGLSGISSPADFDDIAITVFKKTIVAVTAAISKTAQITDVNATFSSGGRRARRLLPAMEAFEIQHLGSRRRLRTDRTLNEAPLRQLLATTGIDVTFTVEVDVREVSASTGNSYDISGPASDDAWATSDASMAIAANFLADLVAELDIATAESDGSSAWNSAASTIVKAMPASVTGAGSLSLSAETTPAAYDTSALAVTVCKWNDPCFSPTPGPTIPRPSQVPTPVPTIDYPYAGTSLTAASTTFMAVAIIQLVFCAGLAYKYASHSTKKKHMRSDWAADTERAKFESAHIVDLFGTAGSAMSKDKDFKHNRKEHLGPLTFTDDMVNHMFKALDLDGDSFISKRDLELWLRNQKVGKAQGFAGVLELDEIDAFLHGGFYSIGARGGSMDRSFCVGASGSARIDFQKKRLESSRQNSSRYLIVGDLNEGPTPLEQGQALLSREDLGKCLARFPMLAFDWEDPLGVATERSAFAARAQGRAISRESCSEIFRRLDTDGDGWVKASDVRIWRRMLPLGRDEEHLVMALLARATKTHAADSRRSLTGATETITENDMGIKSLDLFMTLRDDPVLGAELSAQCALLDYLLAVKEGETGTEEVDHTDAVEVMRVDEHGGEDAFDDNLLMLDSWKKTPKDKFDGRVSKDVSPDSSAGGGGVLPSDAAIAAFICVAKLKICRLTVAQHEIDTREDTVAGEVYKVLAGSRGYVTCTDFQRYLQKKVGLYSLSREDIALILGDMHVVEENGEVESEFYVQAIGNEVDLDIDGNVITTEKRLAHEKRFNRVGLREVFSRSVHHKLANRLHTHMSVKQRMASNAAVKAAMVKGKPLLNENGAPVQIVAPFTGDMVQKPVVLGVEGMQTLFKQIEAGADLFSEAEKGYITPRHVKLWMNASEASDLISIQDIESLFQPDLPNFSGTAIGHDASSSKKGSSDEDHHATQKTFELDENYASVIQETLNNSPVPGGLNERAFFAALKRRPLLSARFALIMKLSKAVSSALLAESSVGAAAAAATAAATAKAQYEKHPEDDRYRLASESAADYSRSATANASETLALARAGRGGGTNPEIKELELLVADAEKDDAYGPAAIALRKQLKEVKSRGTKHELAVLFIEIGMSVKLLELREASQFPVQTSVLQSLSPLDYGVLSSRAIQTSKTSEVTSYIESNKQSTKVLKDKKSSCESKSHKKGKHLSSMDSSENNVSNEVQGIKLTSHVSSCDSIEEEEDGDSFMTALGLPSLNKSSPGVSAHRQGVKKNNASGTKHIQGMGSSLDGFHRDTVDDDIGFEAGVLNDDEVLNTADSLNDFVKKLSKKKSKRLEKKLSKKMSMSENGSSSSSDSSSSNESSDSSNSDSSSESESEKEGEVSLAPSKQLTKKLSRKISKKMSKKSMKEDSSPKVVKASSKNLETMVDIDPSSSSTSSSSLAPPPITTSKKSSFKKAWEFADNISSTIPSSESSDSDLNQVAIQNQDKQGPNEQVLQPSSSSSSRLALRLDARNKQGGSIVAEVDPQGETMDSKVKNVSRNGRSSKELPIKSLQKIKGKGKGKGKGSSSRSRSPQPIGKSPRTTNSLKEPKPLSHATDDTLTKVSANTPSETAENLIKYSGSESISKMTEAEL